MTDSTDPMGSTVAGSADLQASMDRLDGAVVSLTTAIQGMSNGNGTTTSPAMSAAAGGATFTGGTYAGAGGGSGGLIGGGGGNNGSGGTGGTNPFSFSGLLSSGNLAQGLVNAGTSVVNGAFQQGAAQLNTQATINAYGYTQAAFWNTSASSNITNNFGGGSGSNLSSNNLGLNPTNAALGGTMLSQISGQANYTGTSIGGYGRGNAPFQAAATTGMANPGLGAVGAASVSGAFYNPSTSYNLMMMGVGTTPFQLGTGASNSMTSVEAAIGNRFGFQGYNSKTGTFNSSNLSANLSNPLFQIQMMDATGMNQQQYQQWAQQWAQMNTWSNASGQSMGAIQTDVSNYMNPGTGGAAAQKTALANLKKIPGFNMSLLQSMNQSNALQTGAEAGGNAAFVSGLQAATDAINKLTGVLSGGMQKVAGVTGAAGAVGSLNASGVVGAGSGSTNALLGTALSAINSATSLGTVMTSLPALASPSATKTTTATGKAGSGTQSASSTMPAWAKAMATKFGWGTASDLAALNTVEMNEAGWNSTIFNGAGSGAFGIAQALGHGAGAATQGSLANQYGGYGISNATAKLANSGNAQAQFQWMLNYIKDVYKSPGNLLTTYNSRSPHWYADGTSSTKPGLALVGERGPELVAMSGGQQIINSSQTAKMMQPSFGGGAGAGSGGGLAIVFQSGAVTMHNSGGGTTGYHTSGDVQASAAQFVQAIETALNKSSVLKNIAAGVTG